MKGQPSAARATSSKRSTSWQGNKSHPRQLRRDRGDNQSDSDASGDDDDDDGKGLKTVKDDVLGFYIGVTRLILRSAKLHLRVLLLAVDAYPSVRVQMDFAKESFENGCKDVLGRAWKGAYPSSPPEDSK